MGKNQFLFYFMFQAIRNSLEGYYFLLDKSIILVERGRPPPLPPEENSIKIIILFTPSLSCQFKKSAKLNPMTKYQSTSVLQLRCILSIAQGQVQHKGSGSSILGDSSHFYIQGNIIFIARLLLQCCPTRHQKQEDHTDKDENKTMTSKKNLDTKKSFRLLGDGTIPTCIICQFQ